MKVSKKAVIRDLAVRVRQNEEGVRSFLSRAGIDSGDSVQLADLQQLQRLNPEAFNEMVAYLYNEKAGADTKAAPNKDTLNFVGGLVGSIVGTAGSTLASIFGKTDQSDVIALQEQIRIQQQKTTYLIIGAVAIVAIVIAVIAMRSSKGGVVFAK